jgi:thioester reductase-like protein
VPCGLTVRLATQESDALRTRTWTYTKPYARGAYADEVSVREIDEEGLVRAGPPFGSLHGP